MINQLTSSCRTQASAGFCQYWGTVCVDRRIMGESWGSSQKCPWTRISSFLSMMTWSCPRTLLFLCQCRLSLNNKPVTSSSRPPTHYESVGFCQYWGAVCVDRRIMDESLGSPQNLFLLPDYLFDDNINEKVTEEQLYRKIRVQMQSEKLLRSSSLPPNMADTANGSTMFSPDISPWYWIQI